jgi:hypothetical protein
MVLALRAGFELKSRLLVISDTQSRRPPQLSGATRRKWRDLTVNTPADWTHRPVAIRVHRKPISRGKRRSQ